MVRELGFLDLNLADTPYPPSAVHALIEIDGSPGITAAELAERLLLDRSTVSRMLRKIADAGEIRVVTTATDRRHKALTLTRGGMRTVGAIHAYGTTQVANALAPLSDDERATVARGITLYADALARSRNEGAARPQAATLTIDHSLRPGDVGSIVSLHAREYAKIANFGIEFEALVARDIAAFIARADPLSHIWVARTADGNVAGSIAMDLAAGASDAHLRWFILSPASRGSGIGLRLIRTALEHADSNGVSATRLWTFAGLDAARSLYERHGFTLAAEQVGSRWGATVTEQQFVRHAPRASAEAT